MQRAMRGAWRSGRRQAAAVFARAVPDALIDFRPGAWPGAITFVRAGAASRFDASGALAVEPANVPLIEHDPVNLARLGWLTQEPRSNLIPRNNDFVGASWTKVGLTLTPGIDGPDDLASATRCIPTTVSELHRVRLTLPVENSQYYWLTGFVRGVGAQPPVITFNSADTQFGAGSSHAWLDLVSGVVTNPGTLAQAFARPVKNGYYWFAYGARCVASGSAGFEIYAQQGATLPLTATWAGDGTSGYELSRVQIEAGEFPTSPIDTSGSAVTRPAETATIPAAAALLGGSTSRGTALIDARLLGYPASSAAALLSLGTTLDDRMQLRAHSGTGLAGLRVVRAGDSVHDGGVAMPALDRKMAVAWEPGRIDAWCNGQRVAALATDPPAFSAIRLGGGSGSVDASAIYRSAAFWGRALSPDALRRLTM